MRKIGDENDKSPEKCECEDEQQISVCKPESVEESCVKENGKGKNPMQYLVGEIVNSIAVKDFPLIESGGIVGVAPGHARIGSKTIFELPKVGVESYSPHLPSEGFDRASLDSSIAEEVNAEKGNKGDPQHVFYAWTLLE